MAHDLEMERVQSADFRTCGEITTLLSVGKKEFFLNCRYCEYTCLTLDDFIQHIYDDHLQQFVDLSLERKNTIQPVVQWEDEKEDLEFSDPSVSQPIVQWEEAKDFEFSDGSGNDDEGHSNITYFENVEIVDKSETRDDVFVTKEKEEEEEDEDEDEEEILSERSLEEEALESYDQEEELSGEISGYADSDPENTSTGQHNLWDKQFDLPERGRTAAFLNQAESKKFILELIEVYRTLPALWKVKSKEYGNRYVRREQYEILLKKYKEKFPNATRNDVKNKIQCLRTCYRRELKRIPPNGLSTLYYFDAMNFLRENVLIAQENGSDEMQVTSKGMGGKFTKPESLLNDAELINLAKIYKKYTCLWDENDIAYRFANRRREALANVLDEINGTIKTKITKSDLEKEILVMRKICSNEKKEKIACKRRKLLYKPICPYFNDIEYLEPNVTPFECTICSKVYVGVCQYRNHVASHDGSFPYSCQICDRGFKLATNLAVHLRRHAQDYTYSCEVCNKPLATTTELKSHMRYHTGEKPYVCDVCGKSFTSLGEFRRHVVRHDKPRIKCKICSRPFYDNSRLAEHMIVHTKVRDKRCDICGKLFASRKHLQQHKLIHNPEKKYECTICGKRFAQGAGLNGHMKSHGTKINAKDSENPVIE